MRGSTPTCCRCPRRLQDRVGHGARHHGAAFPGARAPGGRGQGKGPLAELITRIDTAVAYVRSFQAAQIDGSETRQVTRKLRGNPVTFTGVAYLLTYAMPNFYFHVTTTYAILRHNGVEIGQGRLPRTRLTLEDDRCVGVERDNRRVSSRWRGTAGLRRRRRAARPHGVATTYSIRLPRVGGNALVTPGSAPLSQIHDSQPVRPDSPGLPGPARTPSARNHDAEITGDELRATRFDRDLPVDQVWPSPMKSARKRGRRPGS